MLAKYITFNKLFYLAGIRRGNHHLGGSSGHLLAGLVRQRPKQQVLCSSQAKPFSRQRGQDLQISKRRLDSATVAGSGEFMFLLRREDRRAARGARSDRFRVAYCRSCSKFTGRLTASP